MKLTKLNLITGLVILLSVFLAIVSIYGSFDSETYIRDSLSMRAQGIGQDLVDLFIVVPFLLISLYYTGKGSKTAVLILTGLVFYILYSFVIYCFGVHFNKLFLYYCAVLGLSLYTFIILMHEFGKTDIKSWFIDKVPTKSAGVYLIVIAVMFYLLWFKEVLPAIMENYVPKSITENDLLVNPIHVIDISFALPGLIISAVLLIRKRNLGYALAPIALIFTLILTIALIGMVVMLKLKGISDDISVAFIFIVLSVISITFLISMFSKIKKEI